MARQMFRLSAVFLAISVNTADACATQDEVMAHFESVKDAYIAKAPTLAPDLFPIWAGHLEQFGKSMGALDFPSACSSLDNAVVELGLETALSQGAATTEQSAPAELTTTDPAPTRRTRVRSRPRRLF